MPGFNRIFNIDFNVIFNVNSNLFSHVDANVIFNLDFNVILHVGMYPPPGHRPDGCVYKALDCQRALQDCQEFLVS